MACESFVDETPKGKLIPETVDDMGMILDGYYDFRSNNIAYAQKNQIYMSDDYRIPDELAYDFSNSEKNSYTWAEHLYTSSEDDSDWNSFYHVIYLCNFILEKIDDAPIGENVYSRDFVKGSALLHKANALLSLVNLYGKFYDETTASTDLGVPLPLESDINIRYARATVAEVYAQIIINLKEAAKILPLTSKYAFQGTKQAALSLLCRIYLYQGNYTESAKKATEVRAIVPELRDYNTLSFDDPEIPDYGISEDSNWPYDGWEVPDVIYFKSFDLWSDKCYISDDLLALMKLNETTDLRFKYFYTNNRRYSSQISTEGYRITDSADKNEGISLGEVIITEAEAKLRNNDIGGALEALNSLREKRYVTGTTDITETNPDNLLKLILNERRRETAFKGLRWFDMKRLKLQNTVTHVLSGETFTLKPGSNRYILPIPRIVIQQNSKIQQNPR